MIIGYRLSAQDNGAYFFHDYPEGVLCPACKTCLDFSWYPKTLRLTGKPRWRDISTTYDNTKIVSERFVEFCKKNKYRNIEFKNVYEKPTLYYIIVENVLNIDQDRAMLRYGAKCAACGNYEYVVGARLESLRQNTEIDDGIFRSDLIFGSGSEKHPILIVGKTTRDKMMAAGIKGAEFRKIEA